MKYDTCSSEPSHTSRYPSTSNRVSSRRMPSRIRGCYTSINKNGVMAIDLMNEGKRPAPRPPAQRRRRKRTLFVNVKPVVMATLASILLLLPCGGRNSRFTAAYHGQLVRQSRPMSRRWLLGSGSPCGNVKGCFYAPPCPPRVPFHYSCQRGQQPHRTPPLGFLVMSSTAVDAAESSESSTAPVSGEQVKVNGEVENGVVNGQNSTSTLFDSVPNNNGKTQSGINGALPNTHESNLPVWETNDQPTDDDVPHPTANGGYSHTKASKAKISAANKGKTPWNKGKTRSEETRARIAAGVRARNRANFLKKLQDMGVTEEEYEANKKEERRKMDAERRARRTEKGGYRPTEETKQKISKLLKEKWARGEIKKGKIDPSKVRRGFTHSAETKAKISESLRKRWANDQSYRENMVQKSSTINSSQDVRKRISDTLKAKWQDPEFRETMMNKIAKRKNRDAYSHGQSHRERISAAIKAKWKDPEYRKKATQAMAKKRQAMGVVAKPKQGKAAKPKQPKKTIAAIQVAEPRKVKVKKVKKTTKTTTTRPKKKTVVARKTKTKPSKASAKTTRKKKKPKGSKSEPDGSISRLREERRDLYDLLYADEDDFFAHSNNSPTDLDVGSVKPTTAFAIGDEDLDDFDPYGLEDF